MVTPGFLAVDTERVVRAGQETAGTAEGWQSWGDRSKTVFEATEQGLRSPTIYTAVEDYGGGVILGAGHCGRRVVELGLVTGTAGVVVDEADVESAADLTQQGATVADQGSMLTRPINTAPVLGDRVAV